MQSHATQSPPYVSLVEGYMNTIKRNVLEYPGTAKLTEHIILTCQNGAESDRERTYLSGWELKGPNGTITIHASISNAEGASPATILTLKVPGSASAEARFGADCRWSSAVENVFPTLKGWIDIVTRPAADLFACLQLPQAS